MGFLDAYVHNRQTIQNMYYAC